MTAQRTSSYDHPEAVSPTEAFTFLMAAAEAVGGRIVNALDADEEKPGDPGYMLATARIELPDGRRFWVEAECPTDDAFV